MVNSVQDILVPLAWDTESFGLPVARITAEAAGPADVAEALDLALAQGIQLVYWAGAPQQSLPAALLAQFAGALVDRKATFRRDLLPADARPPAVSHGLAASGYPKGPASPALLKLALAAGERSRFRVDPRFPRAAFEGPYRAWMERSCQGEIAAAVLVLTALADPTDLHGMVTVGIEGQIGRIGLIAVAERARGRGVGGALMRLAHQGMALRGCASARVTTQFDNTAACRLYQSAGYQLDTLQHIYHFWPLGR